MKLFFDELEKNWDFMSLKNYLFFSHLDPFPDSLGAASVKKRRFDHHIGVVKTRYRGRCDDVMMAGYCWSIRRAKPTASQSLVSMKHKFVP